MSPPSVSHDVGGFEVAMKDAEGVRGGEAIGDLNAGGQDQLKISGPSAMSLSRALPGMYCITM